METGKNKNKNGETYGEINQALTRPLSLENLHQAADNRVPDVYFVLARRRRSSHDKVAIRRKARLCPGVPVNDLLELVQGRW